MKKIKLRVKRYSETHFCQAQVTTVANAKRKALGDRVLSITGRGYPLFEIHVARIMAGVLLCLT